MNETETRAEHIDPALAAAGWGVVECSRIWREYPPDFFDFIIIDECHRGGANDESRWRGMVNRWQQMIVRDVASPLASAKKGRHGSVACAESVLVSVTNLSLLPVRSVANGPVSA